MDQTAAMLLLVGFAALWVGAASGLLTLLLIDYFVED